MQDLVLIDMILKEINLPESSFKEKDVVNVNMHVIL